MSVASQTAIPAILISFYVTGKNFLEPCEVSMEGCYIVATLFFAKKFFTITGQCDVTLS